MSRALRRRRAGRSVLEASGSSEAARRRDGREVRERSGRTRTNLYLWEVAIKPLGTSEISGLGSGTDDRKCKQGTQPTSLIW